MAKPKLGSGARFKALESKLAKRGDVTNPAAVAASIGRKKFGAKKMASMAAAGRKASVRDSGRVKTGGGMMRF